MKLLILIFDSFQTCVDEVEMVYYQDTIKVALNQTDNLVYLNENLLTNMDDLPHGVEVVYPSINIVVVRAKDLNYEVEADILNREISIR